MVTQGDAPSRRASIQKKLARVRAPRVHLTYDVEVGGALEQRELPFVVGILADLSGQRDVAVPLRDRRFIDIDADSFDAVLARIAPKVAVRLPGDGAEMELGFSAIDDFMPRAVGAAVEAAGTRPCTSDHLHAILHHPTFQRLEATWRGLYYLVTQVETSAVLKLRVLDVSKRELLRDMARAPEFDQSTLFKKVYEEEYGTFGGMPFGVLIGDYEFSAGNEDVATLEKIACIAATAHAPFIAGASPALLGLERFGQLAESRDLAAISGRAEFAKWRGFRRGEDARYVALTIPRILLRRPYSESGDEFDERTDDVSHRLWGNAAYALAACVANAFARFGWCAAIRGGEGGGVVEGLPVTALSSGDDAEPVKMSTEVLISDRREKELADLGVIPLVPAKGRDYATFFSLSTCAEPKRYDLDGATANSRLSAQLQYVLTASRFAHYLKSIARDKVASFMTRQDYERFLSAWIAQYVLGDDDATVADKAKRPLREASITVEHVPGRPGMFRTVAYLRPHYQLEELSVSLRLVIDLPTAAAR